MKRPKENRETKSRPSIRLLTNCLGIPDDEGEDVGLVELLLDATDSAQDFDCDLSPEGRMSQP